MHRAARGVVVAGLALTLGALLNAQGLRKSAEIQPQGFGRDVGLALTRPLVSVSHALYLDRPRQELKVAIGHGGDDRIDTTVALPAVAPRVARRAVKAKPAVTTTPQREPSKRPKKATKAPKAALPTFTPARPLRIWVAGDSLAEVPGQALERAAGSGGPVDVVGVESRLATGLGRPDVYNWFERIPQAIGELHPRVAVLSFGADDAHNYLSGAPPGDTIGPLGSPSWNAEYRRRVEGVLRELAADHVYVVWLGLPIIRGPTQNASFRKVDRILRSVIAGHPETSAYIDTYRMFATPRGRYTDYLRNAHRQLVLMRAPDGVHYEPAAGDQIARAVLQALGHVFRLKQPGGRHP